jgi:hypothetical protein
MKGLAAKILRGFAVLWFILAGLRDVR